MSDAIATGILTALSAIVGGGLTAWFGFLKQGSEEKRWYADFYLGPKVEALRLLHSEMAKAHYSLLRDHARARSGEVTFSEFRDRIEPKEFSYLDP